MAPVHHGSRARAGSNAGVMRAIALVFAGLGMASPATAADKSVTIGIQLPLSRADAEGSLRLKYGADLAIEEANAAGGIAGYKVNVIVLDSASTTAGQYDPALAATNARKLVGDPSVVGVVGPMMSGEGKAMAGILSEGDLATITPSATNPDLTDPKFAAQYRPKGRPVFFRTVATDAFAGPNMANYLRDSLKVSSVYILDDTGAYGVGLAAAFEEQARKIGIRVLGHDQIDPREVDYTTALTKIKALNPDALYYGGVQQSGTKLAKQAAEIIPKAIKAGGDGMFSPGLLKGAGFPAADGWYATSTAPHVTDDPAVKAWIERFAKRFNRQPDDYSITAYDAALVILDAVKRVAASGSEVTRSAVRDAIQATKLGTLQGDVAFDENGDIASKTISVFQVRHDTRFPDDDMLHQWTYVGVAPPAPKS